MGEIHIFNIKNNWRNWDFFIETGTGQGESLLHAKNLPFKELVSFEIHPEIYKRVRFLADERTQIINYSSLAGLKEFVPKIPKDKKILFWLDAHFPGADYLLGEYKYDEVSMPLYNELQIIEQYRADCKDTILVDDVHLYDREKLERFMPDHTFTTKRIGEWYGCYSTDSPIWNDRTGQ